MTVTLVSYSVTVTGVMEVVVLPVCKRIRDSCPRGRVSTTTDDGGHHLTFGDCRWGDEGREVSSCRCLVNGTHIRGTEVRMVTTGVNS